MPASVSSVFPALHTAPHAVPCAAAVVPARPAFYDGPRAVAAEFFTLARGGRAQTAPPPFRDGDSASCPLGTEWLRREGRWIVPGQPDGLTVPDRTVTGWWRARHKPGSRFALVHRLTAEETGLISGEHYTCSFLTGDVFSEEVVTGAWLRSLAWQAARTRTVSVHLELPSAIVTLHSRLEGDVFFHPAAPASHQARCA